MRLRHIALYSLSTFTLLLAETETTTSQKPWALVAQWDNDMLTGTDRGYTNGSRIAFLQELSPDSETHNTLQQLLYKLSAADSGGFLGDERRFLGEDPVRFSWGMGLTQLMYTPDNYNTPSAPAGERPYAGWLGIELSLNVSDRDSVGGVTLSLGTTGEYAYAEEAQDWVHENISNSPIYKGWDSQVPSEPTINLHFDRKQKVHWLETENPSLMEIDGYYEWGAALGNFRTNAYVGALTRFGYNLTNTYATPRVQLGSYGHDLFAPEDADAPSFSLSGFAGVRGTAVLHDITLDGPLFRDFDTGVETKPLVGELIYGIAMRMGAVDLSLSQTLRSDEFEGQSENQRFGSVMLRLDLAF